MLRDQKRQGIAQKMLTCTSWELFSKDKDFQDMRKNYDSKFSKIFSKAYRKYIDGDWATAEDLFT